MRNWELSTEMRRKLQVALASGDGQGLKDILNLIYTQGYLDGKIDGKNEGNLGKEDVIK